jgi:aspartate racemase
MTIKKMPLIGIIGGCGPFATLDIERKILAATMLLCKPKCDQDFYPMITLNKTQLQDRLIAFYSDNKHLQQELISGINELFFFNVDIFLIACQSAHVFLEDSLQHLKKPKFINMIDTTIDRIKGFSLKQKKIGVLGTKVLYSSNQYQVKLKQRGIEAILPNNTLQEKLSLAISFIKMEGGRGSFDINGTDNSSEVIKSSINKGLSESVEYVKDSINYFIREGADKIILGCTELPLILPYLYNSFSNDIFIDSNSICAEAVVKYANKLEKAGDF